MYAITGTGGQTSARGFATVHTELGNTSTIHENVKLYGSQYCNKDVCGTDLFDECNPNCYNSTLVSACKNIDPALIKAFRENCIPGKNNSKEFTAFDSHGKKHLLTCCNQIMPFVESPSSKGIVISQNTTASNVITKPIYYKDMPAEIKIIVTS